MRAVLRLLARVDQHKLLGRHSFRSADDEYLSGSYTHDAVSLDLHCDIATEFGSKRRLLYKDSHPGLSVHPESSSARVVKVVGLKT